MTRRRCPPGVFCIENVTIVFICVIFLIIGIIIYYKSSRSSKSDYGNSAYNHDRSITINNSMPSSMFAPRKGHGDDVFFDIYQPPLRDDRYLTGGALDIRGTVGIGGAVPVFNGSTALVSAPRGGMRINVSTQGTDDSEFRQIGILTPVSGNEERILPLMGRPLFTRRDKWNFYTLNDKNNMIKLPVKVRGQSGTSEYGCDNVYNGDTVYVEGYKEAFKVTAYDNNVVRYLPNYL
jgi:hypothetical protein